jgi:hypothetical protein
MFVIFWLPLLLTGLLALRVFVNCRSIKTMGDHIARIEQAFGLQKELAWEWSQQPRKMRNLDGWELMFWIVVNLLNLVGAIFLSFHISLK